MTDPNTIQDEATLYDPVAFYKPWSGVQTFKRNSGRHAFVDLYSCAENNNVVQTAKGGSAFVLPGETIMMRRGYQDPAQISEPASEHRD